jgi:arabinofuranosyltransferase
MSSRRLDQVVLLLAAATAVLLLVRFRHFYHDDAFITLRYVSRLLAGKGVTFNDGERVEGFTHPLWFGQILLLGRLGVDLVTATRLLGLAYFLGVVLFWWRTAIRPLPLLLLILQGGLALWSWGGLETVSFCFWLCLATHLTLRPWSDAKEAGRRPLAAGLAWGAAALTRPEGAGVALAAMVLLLGARRGKWRDAGRTAAAFLVPFLAYLLFRALYFHDLISVSSRAKLEGIPLTLRLSMAGTYLTRAWFLWIPPLVALGALAAAEARREAKLCLLLSLPLWLGVFLGGGDHMPGGRVLLPPLTVTALAAAWAGSPRGRRPATALWALAGLMAVGECAATFKIPAGKDPAARLGAVVGRYLEASLPAGTLVAASTAGSTTFEAPSLRFIDMLGLNDPRIARRHIDRPITAWQRMPGHLKGDGAYVLSRSPDVIILGPSQGFLGENPREWFLSDYEILSNPAFREGYEPFCLFPPLLEGERRDPVFAPMLGPDGKGIVLVAYLRRGSAAVRALEEQGQALYPPWEQPPEQR